jgi:hypothetical protein
MILTEEPGFFAHESHELTGGKKQFPFSCRFVCFVG